MTEMDTLRAEAAEARQKAARDQLPDPRRKPEGRPERFPLRAASTMRAKTVTRDDKEWYQVEGYASVTERGYEMWDMFGPYTEVVSASAFDRTLAAGPEVVFRFNHAGTPMAGTSNSRLELWADETGLGDRAWLNPTREDVKLLVQAMSDGDIREQSFMFTIERGQWSPDYSEYRIEEANLDRGDVGPVTYGASPHTTIATRGMDFLHDIDKVPTLMAREAFQRLSDRDDVLFGDPMEADRLNRRIARLFPPPEPEGPSLALIRAQIDAEKDLGL